MQQLLEPARERLRNLEKSPTGRYDATSFASRLNNGFRFEHDFYADKNTPRMIIHSVRFTIMRNLSLEAAELIAQMLPDSDVDADKIVDYAAY